MKPKMFQNNENPNEETTLLGKFRRRRNTNSASTITSDSLFEELNMSNGRYQWKWSKIRFYLIEPMVLILVFAYNLSGNLYYFLCKKIHFYESLINTIIF